MFLPFEGTAGERKARGDPRLSVRERYPTQADYIARVTAAALSLQREGFLLPEDALAAIEQASQRRLLDAP